MAAGHSDGGGAHAVQAPEEFFKRRVIGQMQVSWDREGHWGRAGSLEVRQWSGWPVRC